MAVGTALYGIAAAAYVVLTIDASDVAGPLRYALSALTAMAAFSAACVVGLPPALIPFAPLAAVGFFQFYCTRRLGPYLLFSACAMVCVVAFTQSAFWFLDFNFRVIPLSLQHFNLATEALLGLCLAIPGLAFTNISPGVTGLLLMVQAVGLSTLETVLYWQREGMYPVGLLILTSGLGYCLASRLEEESRVLPAVGWLLRCICLSKLAIALLPDVWGYPSLLLVALTISPIYLGDGSTKTGAARRRGGGMSLAQGAAHAVAVGVSLLATRHTLLGGALAILSGGADAPSEGALLGATIMAAAAATVPLSRTHFRHRKEVRRFHVFTLIIGVLLLAVSPEVIEGESVLSSPFHALTEASLGLQAARPSDSGVGRWARWLLLFALSVAAAAATGLLALPRSMLARVFVSGSVGGSFGLFVCGTFLPPSPVLYGLLSGSCVLALGFVVFSRYPTANSHKLMPLNFAVFVALFPMTYLIQAEVYMHSTGRQATHAFLLHRTALVGLYAALSFVLALSANLNIAVHARAAKVALERRRKSGARGAPGGTSGGQLALRLEQDYLPVCGNGATVLCYLLCILLNTRYLEGTVYGCIGAAPLMLLLSPGKQLFTDFDDPRRYAPVVSSVFISCSVAAAQEVLALCYYGKEASIWLELEEAEPVEMEPLWLALKNAALLGMAMVSVHPDPHPACVCQPRPWHGTTLR